MGDEGSQHVQGVTLDLPFYLSGSRAGGLPSLLAPREPRHLLSVRSGEEGGLREQRGPRGRHSGRCGSHAQPATGGPALATLKSGQVGVLLIGQLLHVQGH